MKRVLVCCALAVPLAMLSIAPALADVRTKEKGLVKFEGMLGRMVGLFGGKAARDGVVTTTAVKGDRKVTMGENSARIVDLSEEKIYELDLKKKTYEVTTFDELRRRMREAQEKAEREAQKEEQREGEQKGEQPTKEWEIDFDVRETGETKTIAGYDARRTIMTVIIREKGQTLEDGGGIVTTSDVWMGPRIPEMDELHRFEERYWKQLQGPDAAAISAEQMAALLATFPQVQQAMERLHKEGRSAQGTALQTHTTFESVKSKEQMAQQPADNSAGGGLGGMLARKMMKKQEPKARALILTMDSEVQEVTTSVPSADLDIPAGFKQKT